MGEDQELIWGHDEFSTPLHIQLERWSREINPVSLGLKRGVRTGPVCSGASG